MDKYYAGECSIRERMYSSALVDLWTDLDAILRRVYSTCARLRAAKASPTPATRPRWAVVTSRATYRPRRLPDSYG